MIQDEKTLRKECGLRVRFKSRGEERYGKREEIGEEMNMEVTDGVDGQRMVGMDVGLIDYKIRNIITKSERGMNTCSGGEAMLRNYF